MRRRLLRVLVGVAASALLAGTLSAVLPSGPASASVPPPDPSSSWCGSPGESVAWTEIAVEDSGDTVWAGVIHRAHATVICIQVDGTPPFFARIGFALLEATSSTTHHIEVCDYQLGSFTERVNVADAAGNATAQVIPYTDDLSTDGCKQADITYPVRKFRAVWLTVNGDSFASGWQAGPPKP